MLAARNPFCLKDLPSFDCSISLSRFFVNFLNLTKELFICLCAGDPTPKNRSILKFSLSVLKSSKGDVKWLGHANVSTTQVYAQFAPSYDKDIENLSIEKPDNPLLSLAQIIQFPYRNTC